MIRSLCRPARVVSWTKSRGDRTAVQQGVSNRQRANPGDAVAPLAAYLQTATGCDQSGDLTQSQSFAVRAALPAESRQEHECEVSNWYERRPPLMNERACDHHENGIRAWLVKWSAAFRLKACVNGTFRRCNRLSFFPLCSSLRMSRYEIFHFAPNSDARARSVAFSRQRIWAAPKTWIFYGGHLILSLAQRLASVPESRSLHSSVRRGDLFQELSRKRDFESTLRLPFARMNFPSGKS